MIQQPPPPQWSSPCQLIPTAWLIHGSSRRPDPVPSLWDSTYKRGFAWNPHKKLGPARNLLVEKLAAACKKPLAKPWVGLNGLERSWGAISAVEDVYFALRCWGDITAVA
ncbi:hypothetical protein RHMOL_Rhmol07G0142100 [Rhododendron molle]|uniref:Uncharacterized protein n=1 Tax=Rhododendron molle TaxID=49168 RepID=A0ACC0N161_RHOML|nr:hypothetical protein RHMOL_Rhmol07G0142100 [Rhododendron molle]